MKKIIVAALIALALIGSLDSCKKESTATQTGNCQKAIKAIKRVSVSGSVSSNDSTVCSYDNNGRLASSQQVGAGTVQYVYHSDSVFYPLGEYSFNLDANGRAV